MNIKDISDGLNRIANRIASSTSKKYSSETFNVDKVLKSYLFTALWSSTDDDEEPLDENYSIDDFSRESIRQAKKDVEKFLDMSSALLTQDGKNEEQIGHDFWLTRVGHGAGFWDGDYPIAGDELTKVCKSFRELDIYVGDDNLLYFA